MDINFICYGGEIQAVGMNVSETFDGGEPSEGNVAVAAIQQLIKMRLISSVTCKDEEGNTIIEIK